MAPASVPTLEMAGPTGARVLVAPRSCDDRVGELADALGVDPRDELEVDGRPVARHETITRAGIVRGSRLGAARGSVATAGAAVAVAICDAGPAAGTVVALRPGRHVIGRSPRAGVCIDDPLIETHHALVDVAADGAVTFVQLTGRVPCRVDGDPVGAPIVLTDAAVVMLGASRVRIVGHADPPPGHAVVAASPSDPWRRVLRRTPRVVPRWAPGAIAVPVTGQASRHHGAAGLVAAAVAAVGAGVVAVVMGSAMFVVFAAVGLVASLAMSAVSTVGARRTGRRQRAAWARDVGEFAAAVERQRDSRRRHQAATVPGVAEAVLAASALRDDVWCRRDAHGDASLVAVGQGAVAWTVDLDDPAGDRLGPELSAIVGEASTLDDVAVALDLGAGAAVAISGADAAAVARALVVQLVTWTGPADLQLVVLVGEPDAWDWCRWLPHVAGPDGPRVVAADDGERVAATLAALDGAGGRHVVVVTDRADALSQRTGPLRRFLGSAARAGVVAIVAPDGSPPAMCRSVLEIGSVGMARWWADASVDGHPVTVHAAGVTTATATEVGRALARLQDPEDALAAEVSLGSAVGIGALSERCGPGPIDDPIAVAAGWRAGGDDPAPRAAVGVTADGVVEIDLRRDGPHVLVAGTTGAGKSELLRTLVVSMAMRCSPDHVTFVLVDYKGGSTFDACADLPHTVGVVTDLDEALAERALTSLEAEVRRREHVLRASGAVDLADHRSRGGPALPRLVVVVDEFATLATDVPDFLGSLVGVAQRGRSLGIHLVLATQRPAGVVSDDIRANTNLRIALRLQDLADARDVVGHDAPASFPRGAPGRAMLRLGADEHVIFQAARSTAPADPVRDDRLRVVAEAGSTDGGESELAVLVRTIRNAAALCDIAAPHRPWLPPLPALVDVDELDAVGGGEDAVGLVDDPAAQCRRPLRWRPEDGNLAILGAVGAGTTTALRAVVVATVRGRPPAACHVYVVDARGDARLDELAALAHCGGVVRPHERERLSRLLRRLVAEIDTRRAGADRVRQPVVVLAVDGLSALRTSLDDPIDHGDLDLLGRILAEGAAAGVMTVWTAERPAAVPASMMATCAERWLGRLDDPAEASICGVPASSVPRGGPGRFVTASTRLVAQVVELAAPRHVPIAASGPSPLGVLPAVVVVAPAGSVGPGGGSDLVLGIEFDGLDPAVLAVPDGEHVLVAGPARSGRTSALAATAAAWQAAHPLGRVLAVAPRGSSDVGAVVDVDAALAAIGERTGHAATLLLVDDAERVDDPRLGALAAERHPGLLIVAAGRPDALRALYGHWTAVVRRSRLGILMTACADIDGDLLGELLPRRAPVPPRPGLAWLIDAAGRRLAQLSTGSLSRP